MRASIAFLITCHNRCEKTIACLTALENSCSRTDIFWHIWLCDDKSSDDTIPSITKKIGERVTIINGNGSLFWCRGMIAAWTAAAATQPDAVIWLNDDVLLDLHAIGTLLTASTSEPGIIVGAVRAPDIEPQIGQLPTYGGRRRGPWWNRLKTELIPISSQIQLCDTFNGNVVLVPRRVWERIGTLDYRFTHTMGDLDYGFRAKRSMIPCLITQGTLGVCSVNPPSTIPSSRWARLRRMYGLKYCPPVAWLRLTYRHAGILWPVVWIIPYLRALRG